MEPNPSESAEHRDKGTKVFRDPIHDLIYLGPEDRWVLDLIDTKEFQRLRRIRQLGLAHFVYPAAEHSRFTHSLGVFNFARRMLRKLRHRHVTDEPILAELTKHEKAIKAAALLHDIGHGPFSHVFERVFAQEPGTRKHDEWSCEIIRDRGTEVHQVLARPDNGIDIELVCGLISDSADTQFEPYLKDIVSSQLDADRMDYLLRDSWMTGSEYGRFDVEWILNALVIGEPKLGVEPRRKLCLDARKGTGAIEGLLFARSLMTQHVYGHKTTRAYEAEFMQTLRLAVELREHLPEDTPSPVKTLIEKRGDLNTKEFLLLDDEVLWWALRRWAVWKPDRLAPVANVALAEALSHHALRLVRRQQPWKFEEVRRENVQHAPVLFKHIDKVRPELRFECYLDTLDDSPYKDHQFLTSSRRDQGAGEEEESFFRGIFLLTADGPEELSQADTSPIMEGLAKKTKRYRFYFDRRFLKDFSGLLHKFGVC